MPEGTPHFTLLKDGMLVAKIWQAPGQLRRAGARGASPLCELSFADIEIFDAKSEAVLVQLAQSAKDIDALLFKLKLEEFTVAEGEVRLGGSGVRRF